MAKIHEEVVLIKISKLVKENEDAQEVVTTDLIANLEAVATELVGENVIVEVEKA